MHRLNTKNGVTTLTLRMASGTIGAVFAAIHAAFSTYCMGACQTYRFTVYPPSNARGDSQTGERA